MDIDIFVYSDESGVFDYKHNEWFVFGGIITLSKEEKDGLIRLYKKAEESIAPKYGNGVELKASVITTKERTKLFRSMNRANKFGVVIKQSALNGLYELREALLQEFKEGTFNYDYNKYFEPIFPTMKGLDLHYCNSLKNTLIRASDIIANRIYHEVVSGKDPVIRDNLFITYLP